MDLEANVNIPKTSSEGGGKRDHNDVVMGVTAADAADGGDGDVSTTKQNSSSAWCSSKNVIIVWIPMIGVIIALGFLLKATVFANDPAEGWLIIPAFYSLAAAVGLSVLGCCCAACLNL
mmetsp:Transcript_9170/g.10633  ORF Transcript_9170/g.10633 Transcript_9170/m.10633 type:complete len:119 (+) Transcript_9170:448-804(+)|eukprot:CAMPEP_0204642282 /NCGR_PEP_ID=MMETSP0717-20131115/51601_1 /ASSEMBLY_ACC=CAM_ASM_000666 /TAXON_ID=230516 /ORGANISM="Chaetoceros curvisetus" /LENGTH=118 /DNA_ID=CAMNT_0051663043 /DNA_START=316 /DNA_END=672 /DNA_ORIENTATION=+